MAEWWDELYTQPVETPPPPAQSKIEKFQQDQTKVGKVEQAVLPKVASGIEKAKKSPFGFIVNPALTLLEAAGKYVIQPATQAVSTALLTPQAIAQGKGLQSFRYASQQAKKISMGQALAGSVGKVAGSVLPDAITPTFMDSNFNIFDDKQRDKAFRDEYLGIIASGATDLALAAIGTKGAGALVKSGTKAVVGPSKIVTAGDMKKFTADVEEVVNWATRNDGTKAPTGLAVLMDDAVKNTNVTKLASNPLVSETSNPYRTATILSRLDNHRDVADYLLAERGDTAAFVRFFERRPIDADHIDNYGFNLVEPISDFSGISLQTITPKLTSRYQKIINAKAKEDPKFAAALDDFLSKTTDREGAVIESFTPGKYAAIESLTLGKKKLQQQALYGDLKLLEKMVTMVGVQPYTNQNHMIVLSER